MTWHVELNKTFGVQFWNKTYGFTASIKNDNKIKWMQYQIVRNCQFSNYRVNKFKPNISSLCSYCHISDEKLSHLYFQCFKVKEFWDKVQDYFANLSVIIPLEITAVLFGYSNECSDSKINYILLIAKRYIWTNKFSGAHLSINAFKNIFKKKLIELKDMFEYRNELEKFKEWQPILDVI